MLMRWRKRARLRRELDALTEALEAQRFDEAVALGEAAVATAADVHGADAPETIAPRYALAAAQVGLGDLDAADAVSTEALRLARRHPVGLEPPLPMLYEQRLAIAERRGDDAAVGELLASLERAYERMRAPDRVAQASVLHRRALHLARGGGRAAAAPLFTRAAELTEGPARAEVLYNQASLAPEDHPPAGRLALFERATRAEPEPALAAKIAHNRATVLEELGEIDEARQSYEEALALLDAQRIDARATLVRLARLHHAARNFSAAIPLYQRALDRAEEPEVSDRIATWLGDAHSEVYR